MYQLIYSDFFQILPLLFLAQKRMHLNTKLCKGAGDLTHCHALLNSVKHEETFCLHRAFQLKGEGFHSMNACFCAGQDEQFFKALINQQET